jgi:hypothetical protein
LPVQGCGEAHYHHLKSEGLLPYCFYYPIWHSEESWQNRMHIVLSYSDGAIAG